MRGYKVEGAEAKASAELRQLKQQFDAGAITADMYKERQRPLLAIMVAGPDNHIDASGGEAGTAASGPPRRAVLPRAHPMQAAVTPNVNPIPQVQCGAEAATGRKEGTPPNDRGKDVQKSSDVVYSQADKFDLAGAEKAVRHEFDPRERKWSRSAFLCRIESKPFAVGSMRKAHRLWDLAATGPDSLFVVKFSKDPKENSQRFFDDVQMQMEARMWAQKFNERGPPKPIDFIAAYVLELVDRPGKPLCGVEKFIPGNYTKWNNNWDWSDELRNTPQAFSHFTWQASGHKLLVCDLQGVGDLYTDPQIHTADRKSYGKGNLGMDGIQKFLSAHKCNSICDFYQLSPTPASNPRRNQKPRGAHSSSGPKRTVVELPSGAEPPRGAPAAPVNTKGLVGVGLALKSVGAEGLVVSHVLPQGPAFKDGRVMAGDILLAVGERKGKIVLEDIKSLILGPPGTTVNMKFKRGNSTFEVTLTRSLSAFPQGQRLVDSQKQRSSVRPDAGGEGSAGDARNSGSGNGNRKSLRQSIMSGIMTGLGFSTAPGGAGGARHSGARGEAGGTHAGKNAGAERESGYDDPEIFRPTSADLRTRACNKRAEQSCGWDDPDIVLSPASRRKGGKGGDLAALQEQWVLLDDGGTDGGVVNAASGWSAVATSEDVRNLVLCILRYLRGFYGTAAMVRLGAVCKLWHSFTMDTSLWTTVRCGDDCVLGNEALSNICNRARGALDVLDIATSPHCAEALRGQVSLDTIVRSVQFNPNIQELHISGCIKHTDHAFAEFGLVLKDLSHLQALSMEACALTGRSVQQMLTLFICSTSLESLSLAHNESLGSDGVSALCAALRVNSTITSLDLRGCHVNRSASENLAEVLLMSPSLTDLQIDAVEQYSEAIHDEVRRHSFNVHAMQKQLLGGAVGKRVDGTSAERENCAEHGAPPRKRGVCDGGYVGGFGALHDGTEKKATALRDEDTATLFASATGSPVASGGAETSGRAAMVTDSTDRQGEIDAIPLAVAPKWPRHIGCQTKMTWKKEDEDRARERVVHQRAAVEMQGMLNEAQGALKTLMEERTRLKTESKLLTEKICKLEIGQKELEAAWRVRLEEERAGLLQEVSETKRQLRSANEELQLLRVQMEQKDVDMDAHKARLHELERDRERIEEDRVRRVYESDDAVEARLQERETQMAREQQEMESKLQIANLANQELEDRLAVAGDAEIKTRLEVEELQKRLAAAEEDALRRFGELASAKEAESKTQEMLMQDLEKRLAATVKTEMQAQLEKDSLRDAVDALKKEMAIKVLAHKEEERRWKEEVELATRLGQQRKYAEDDDRRAKQGDVEVAQLPSEWDDFLKWRHEQEESRSAAASREDSATTSWVHAPGWKGGGEGVGRGPDSRSKEEIVQRKLVTPPLVKEDGIVGVAEKVGGLSTSKVSSKLLDSDLDLVDALGDAAAAHDVEAETDFKQSPAAGSQVATIERAEGSLDTRTREMVMALILKGRSDLQVVKHYTIADRGVTEEHVRALRRALALEQNAAHAGEESTDLQAGPGVEVCDERPYKVVAVVDGSPADACGQIRVGDVLVSVQGQDVDYKTARDIRSLMKGTEGSVINLRLLRSSSSSYAAGAGGGGAYSVSLQRAVLQETQDERGTTRREPASRREAKARGQHVPQDGRDTAGVVESGGETDISFSSASSASNKANAGLGFTFQRDASERYWVVRRLKEGGFAEVSGLISKGDILLRVDGKSVSGIENPEEVALLIAGAEGSSCLVELKSPHTAQIREVQGVRSRSKAAPQASARAQV